MRGRHRTAGARRIGHGRAAGLALAVTAALAVAGCGSSHHGSAAGGHPGAAGAASSGVYGALPASSTPTRGGTLTFGFTTGATPTYILPITPASLSSVFTIDEFQNELFLPLYLGPQGRTPEIDPTAGVAELPTYSDHDRTVTIRLKPGYTWSDGAPVDAQDVIFDVDLIKAAARLSVANVAAYTPGLFPDTVRSMSAPDRDTVVMHLTRAFNPGFFLNDQLADVVFPLPATRWNVARSGGPHLNYAVPANAARIYTYLNHQSMRLGSFATNPLWRDSDGPFVIRSFSAVNSTFVMDANPHFGGSPRPRLSTFEGEAFTSTTAELNALRSGSLDIALLDSSQLGQVGSLRAGGVSVYGYPDLGWNGAFINFRDATGHFGAIASQLYFRQALAHLEDQPGYVKGIFHGAADPAYGPVPSAPVTPFTPTDAVRTVYPYRPAAAAALLRAHGWTIRPGGTDTCERAGNGAGECGAGIPAGTPLRFTWDYVAPAFQEYESLESEAVASEASTIGMRIQLVSKPFNYLVQHLNDANPAARSYTDTWGVSYFGGYTDDDYPTQNSIFNTTGSYNQGGYSSAQADRLIHDSVYGPDAQAVTREAAYLTANVPVLFFPNPDLVYAVGPKVGGTPDAFLALTQYQPFPQDMWLKR